jgi:hypothetical protein
MRNAFITGFLIGILAVLGACDKPVKAGDKCNRPGATANQGDLICKRNNKTTGPLVWRKA